MSRRQLVARVFVTAVSVAAIAVFTACRDDKPNVMPPDGEGPVEVTCEKLTTPSTTADACVVAMGGATRLLKGNVLTPTTVYKGGQVAVDAMGKFACVG